MTIEITTFKCGECDRGFESPRGLLGHQNRVGHKGSVVTEVAKPERKRGQKRTPAEKIKDGLAVERTPCECGCGDTPKGRKSRFLPGHDARHYGRIKRENGIKATKAA